MINFDQFSKLSRKLRKEYLTCDVDINRLFFFSKKKKKQKEKRRENKKNKDANQGISKGMEKGKIYLICPSYVADDVVVTGLVVHVPGSGLFG